MRRLRIASLLAVAALGLSGCGPVDDAVNEAKDKGQQLAEDGATFGACKAFRDRKDAQRAWKRAGKPESADRDGDGKVCESLVYNKPNDSPTSTPRRDPAPRNSTGSGSRPGSSSSTQDGKALTTNCERPNRVVNVTLSRTKYPNVLQHVRESIAKGYPEVLVLNRVGAGARRDRLLRGIDTKPGFDRDESPAAVGRGKGPGLEGGSSPTGWKASVKLVPSSENRSSGSKMGLQLRRFCDGTRFRIVGF